MDSKYLKPVNPSDIPQTRRGEGIVTIPKKILSEFLLSREDACEFNWERVYKSAVVAAHCLRVCAKSNNYPVVITTRKERVFLVRDKSEELV